MKRPIAIALACAVVIALPAATAIAGNGNGKGQVKSLTAKECNAERRADSGAFQAAFGNQSGEHAMRNCKRETRSEVNGKVENAAQECAALRDEMGVDGFIREFGTNEAGGEGTPGWHRNAFGMCVSGKVGEAIEDDVDDFETAAQQCRAARADDPEEFLETWGNNNGPNGENNAPNGENSQGAEHKAFGKCVSSTARDLEQEEDEEEDEE
jgi:hypothetical protein